jgi:hypothetical protein
VSKRRLRISLVAVAALGVMGADAPVSTSSVFQPFTEAAIACAEAVQGKDIASAPIERHGWTRRTQPSGAPAGVAQFWRPDTRFAVDTFNNPPQCTALWDVTSSSGRDAVFASADRKVSQALAQAFLGRFRALEYRTEGDRKLHRFAVGDAVVLVTAEPVGPSGNSVVLKVGATNRQNLPDATNTGSVSKDAEGK